MTTGHIAVSARQLQQLVKTLQRVIPSLAAVYLYGSQAQGTANAASDADIAGRPVDLIDLRAASTVLQHQIITTGKRLWERDSQAALYESFILSEKTALDTARAGLLPDIRKKGRIHGR